MEAAAETEARQRRLRVFFIPFFATSHIIPTVDTARIFAARGIDSTILLTPVNATIIRDTVDSAAASGLHMRILLYPFPSAEAGLPPGVENVSDLPPSESTKIDAAVPFTRTAHERLLRLHRPDAVISDVHYPWCTEISRELGIPRIGFSPIGLFSCCVMASITRHGCAHANASGRDDEPFLVPDFPHPVRLLRSELPDFLRSETPFTAIQDDIFEADRQSLGVAVNSFADLEAAYAEIFLKFQGIRTWLIGPVAYASANAESIEARGGGNDPAAAANRARCLSWLDEKEPKSVVYACFGSWSRFTSEQLREMALGLEAAGHAFLWVIRDGDDEWMPEGFERRVEDRGLVVRGWAPQAAILEHAATGAFVTHCGWNSLLEGLTAGLPMVTWPLYVEQFINEKLVVDVIGVGVKASDRPGSTAEEEQQLVEAAELERAVRIVMGGGEEAEGMRRRAREHRERARAAVGDGGSSNMALNDIIKKIREWHAGEAFDV